MKTVVTHERTMRCMTTRLLLMGLPAIFLCFMPEQTVAAEKIETLRVMFLPNLPEMEIVKTFASFVKALEKETQMKIQVFSGKDYTVSIDKLRKRETDICMLGGFAYISAQDDFGVKIFVRNLEAVKNEKVKDSYRSVIVTRKDSDIKSLEDLKGKRFAFTDPKSTSGFLFPLLGLMDHNIGLKDLASVVYVNKHSNSLIAVFNRQVDAGALADGEYSRAVGVNLNDISILWKSDPIHHGAWVARNDIPDLRVELIKSAFLRISQRKDAAQIFANSYIKGFVPAADADYENVRQAIKLQAAMEKQKKCPHKGKRNS